MSERAAGANSSQSLFCSEQREKLAHGHSIVQSNKSESFRLLFKKEQCSEERRERFALGHKKGKSREKLTKKSNFLVNHSFLRAIRLTSKSTIAIPIRSLLDFLKDDESDSLMFVLF